MLFSAPAFIVGFLPVALIGFFATARLLGPVWARIFLIAASLVFYGWWNPTHVPLLLGSVAVNYGIACGICRYSEVMVCAGRCPSVMVGGGRPSTPFSLPAPSLFVSTPQGLDGRPAPTMTGVGPSLAMTISHPAIWLITGITLNLGLLAWFKYGDFLLHIAAPGAPRLSVTLPLAISFFTFQQIMFLVDTYRYPKRPDLIAYAAFVTFFPHLIAGPIVRPAEIIPQLTSTAQSSPHRDNLRDGLLIFLLGLAKKCVLADMFGGFSDTGFAAAEAGHTLTFFEAWYATLSYALQIYFDFSGYSDMAIGLARMLNIRFPLNFDSPYQSASITEFWRRWHISLGAFLRDYLYIPLGGNRRRRTINLMITMLLAGLWHGAAWTFILWGGLHGLFLVVHAHYRRHFRPMPPLLGQALTLAAVTLAWVPFRAQTFHGALEVLRGLAGFNGIALPRMIVSAMPPLAAIAEPVSVMPSLGDARTLSFPEVTACLILGWFIVLVLPNIHRMRDTARHWALTSSFALSVQAVFFAPHIVPFLYFQF